MTKGAQRSISGWLETKKRGRDDAQIARDQRTALAARKKAVQSRKKTTKTKTTAKKSKKAKKKVTSDSESDFIEESDDHESLKNFIVDDDEESEEMLEVDSDDESNELEIASPQNHSIKMARKGERQSEATYLTVPESSSDEDEGTFLQAAKLRKSKPSAALQRASDAVKQQRLAPLGVKSGISKKQKKRMVETIDLTAPTLKVKARRPQVRAPDDDSENLSSPSPQKTFKEPKLTKKQFYDSDSSSGPVEVQSKYFNQRSDTARSHKRKDPFASDSDEKPAPRQMSPGALSLNDTPDTHRRPKKSLKKKVTKRNPFAEFAHSVDDSDSIQDEDERIAIETALQESLAENQNSNDKSSKAIEDSEKPLIDQILEESSGDEGDDGGDAYDEEQQAATSVLNTAEQLSAQVLATMQQWTVEQTKDSEKSGTAVSASQGMIVDGALSLGNLTSTTMPHDGAGQHNWISDETMRRICPDVKLSSYQLIGVNWLAMLNGMSCKIDGKATAVNGVLADEMGLGKTVQTIAFLAWLNQRRKSQSTQSVEYQAPHLIVVPVSVLPNWVREFEKFCPNMNVVKYHGSQAEREDIQDELWQYLPKNNPKRTLDVILAPVTYFQKEKSDDRRFLNKFRFDYLVIDEAHVLKNSQSTRYRMLNKMSTKHRLLLTGTPVQNSPKELLNMLCFIMPLFAFGSEQMEDETDKGARMLQHFVDAEMEESGDETAAYRKLKHLFAPFVLRRKKEDVISQLLPPKERIVQYVELDERGRDTYDSILKAHVESNGSKVTAAIGDHLFTNLRKAAHHPLLLRNRHKSKEEIEHLVSCFHKYGAFQGEGSTKARVAEELTKFNDFHIHLTALELIEQNRHRRADLDRFILNESDLFSSAKFKQLRQLLPSLISKGHRILIFSGWTSILDLLGCLMEYLGLEYYRMDGSCASDARQEMIDGFNQNENIKVFLLSTRACGLGINLTAADVCCIHDLDFNPFNDLQAEDRCHRIGQTKKVTVYKLVTQGTVDEDIYNMQERKAKMNAAIMESRDERQERKAMLKAAVTRFMESPRKEIIII